MVRVGAVAHCVYEHIDVHKFVDMDIQSILFVCSILCKMNNELFEIKRVPACGLGWVATQDIAKGTLLLKEKQFIFDSGQDGGVISQSAWIDKYLSMSQEEQHCLYNLYNLFDYPESLPPYLKPVYNKTRENYSDFGYALGCYAKGVFPSLMIKLIGIQITNAFNHKIIGLQTSRMNHRDGSCASQLEA